MTWIWQSMILDDEPDKGVAWIAKMIKDDDPGTSLELTKVFIESRDGDYETWIDAARVRLAVVRMEMNAKIGLSTDDYELGEDAYYLDIDGYI